MCGILGAVSNTSTIGAVPIKEGVDSLRHRGPDSQSIKGDQKTWALGHTRLSIIDLSESAGQPMKYSHNGREFYIVLNGEVYNYLEIRSELKELGHTFLTESDTEVIVASYAEWGAECLSRFNGMFAFVIWEEHVDTLFAARDRLGKKPLFYSDQQGVFLFASEIKALRALGVHPSIDKNKFYTYLVAPEYHYFGRSETFYSNIVSLSGGSYLIRTKERTEVREWWSPANIKPHSWKGSFKDAQERLRTLLTEAVTLRLRSDVPVGLALSGGVDSSVILGILESVRKNGNPLHTFTLSHPDRKTDETDIVQKTIEHYKNHISITPHFFELPRTLSINDAIRFCLVHDEPVRSFDVFNQFVLMENIHNTGIKVAMSGQGADELFWGYPRYVIPSTVKDIISGRFKSAGEGVKYLQSFYNTSLVGVLRLFIRSIFPNLFLWKRKRIVASILGLENNKKQSRDTRAVLSGLDPNYQIHEIQNGHLPSLLRDEDRNSMNMSIETRAPFLDVSVVEFALALPRKFNIQNGFTKYLLRDTFKNNLPPSVPWRKTKSGLYEKRTIRYIPSFREDAERYIQSSPFLKKHITTDRLKEIDEELFWRLFNVAIVDLNHENLLSTLQK